MRAKTIVIINDRSQAVGGATNLALLSARLLSDAGHRVVFLTGDSGEGAPLPTSVEVVPLSGQVLLEQALLPRVRDGLFNDAAARLIRATIARLDSPHTVYHLHGWAQTLSPAVFKALSPVQNRLVISAHDFSLVCPNGSYFNFQTDQVCALTPLSPSCLSTHCDKRNRADKAFRSLRAFTRRTMLDLSRTDALIALIHPAMGDWFVRGGAARSRLRTIRNPVTPFSPTRVKTEQNTDLFFIGRLQPEKGALLAAAAARANGRRLRVIGDGPEREALARMAPDVVLEGWRDHAEIGRLIQEARALIMPSRLPEPFGLVALEALQSGVPLVAFADSFVAQEAAGVGAAFLSVSRSPESLAHAVEKVTSDAIVADASNAAFDLCRNFSTTPTGWRDAILALYDEQLVRAAGRVSA